MRGRIATLDAALVATRPAPGDGVAAEYPGLGPTLTAIVLAELGDITWFTKFSQLRKLAGLDIIRVQSGQWVGTARISRCGRPLLRWALYQAALGGCRTPAWRAKRTALLSKRQGDPHVFFKTIVEAGGQALACDLGRLAERAAVHREPRWRPGRLAARTTG